MLKKQINKIILILIIFNNAYGKDKIIKVAFDESMKANYAHNFALAATCPQWKLVRDLFNKNIILNPKISKTGIPKKGHWIWLGSPLPDRCKKLQASWKKHNPDWEFKLWTDKDAATYPMKNRALYNKAVNWGQKSDIFRLEIIRDQGGTYIDTDFECLKPFGTLNKTCDFYIGLGHTPFVFMYNGLIGAVPNHPIILRAIETMKLTGSLTDNENIQQTTGPFHITRCFLEIAPHLKDRTVALPITYLYPFPNSHRNLSNNPKVVASFIKPESLCVHYFDCSWMKK